MKGLSIKQPWAWLIVNGFKDIENRKWATAMKGRVYIHASKVFDDEGYQYVKKYFPTINMPVKAEFDMGGLVGIVEITDCVTKHNSPWFEGTFGFVLRNPQKIKFVPYKGNLKFFEVNY